MDYSIDTSMIYISYCLYHFQHSLSRHVYTSDRMEKKLCFVPCNFIFFHHKLVEYTHTAVVCTHNTAVLWTNARISSPLTVSIMMGLEYSFTIYCLRLRCRKLNQNIRYRERFSMVTRIRWYALRLHIYYTMQISHEKCHIWTDKSLCRYARTHSAHEFTFTCKHTCAQSNFKYRRTSRRKQRYAYSQLSCVQNEISIDDGRCAIYLSLSLCHEQCDVD